MDSISPGATRIAGNHSHFSGGRTFIGKLMVRLWLGISALAPTHRQSGRTSPRPELTP